MKKNKILSNKKTPFYRKRGWLAFGLAFAVATPFISYALDHDTPVTINNLATSNINITVPTSIELSNDGNGTSITASNQYQIVNNTEKGYKVYIDSLEAILNNDWAFASKDTPFESLPVNTKKVYLGAKVGTDTTYHDLSTAYNPTDNLFNMPDQTKGLNFEGKIGPFSSEMQEKMADLNFTVHSQGIAYQVQYNANTGSGSMSNSSLVYGTPATLKKNTFTKVGYTFKGWNTMPDGKGVSFDDEDVVDKLTTEENEVVTLYAQWEANTYKISYELNGGTNGTDSPTTGTYDKVLTISNPTKEGYTFTGWTFNGNTSTAKYGSSSSTVTTSWNSTSTSVKSQYFKNLTPTSGSTITLTAHFEKTVTASFKYYNNQTQSVACKLIDKSSSCNITTPAALGTPSGYSFRGWSTSNTANASIGVAASSNLSLTKDVTYYGSYQTDVTATFYYSTLKTTDFVFSGGSQSSATATAVKYQNYNGSIVNSNFTIPTVVTGSNGGASAENYIGVSKDVSSVTTITPTTAYTEYYAVYTENLTFHYYNGSSHTTSSVIRRMLSDGTSYSNSLSASAPTPSLYDGASFDEWSYIAGSAETNDRRTPLATGVNDLYAKHKKNLTVTYNDNNGTGAPNSSTATKYYVSKTGTSGMAEINPSVKVSETKPTRTGYTFKNWNTSTDGSDISYESGKTYTISSNLTLYAQWTPNDYTYNIVYKSSSGKQLGTASATYNYGTTNTISPKSFTGYTSPANQSVKWDSTTAKTITFTYTPIDYTITWNLNSGLLSGQKTSYNIETADYTLPTPTRTGYTFLGWTGSNGSTAQTTVTIAQGSIGNKTYTANWEKQYSITYNLDGGTLSGDYPTYYLSSKGLSELPTPVKEGYTFLGWTEEVDYTWSTNDMAYGWTESEDGWYYGRGPGGQTQSIALEEPGIMPLAVPSPGVEPLCIEFSVSNNANLYFVANNYESGSGGYYKIYKNGEEIRNVDTGYFQDIICKETLESGDYELLIQPVSNDSTGTTIKQFSITQSVSSIPSGTTGDKVLTAQWEKQLTYKLKTGSEFNALIPTTTTDIVFTDEVMPASATLIDVDADGDGGVVAWLDGTTFKISSQKAGQKILANEDCSYMFEGYSSSGGSANSLDENNEISLYTFDFNVSSIVGLENLDTSNTIDMSYMFSKAGFGESSFSISGLSEWNTSSVTNMSYMFYSAGYGATTFNLDLSNWNTSSVTNMSSMFSETGRYGKTIDLDLSGWNTSSVTNMRYMFFYTGSDAKTIDLNLSNWNVSSVTDMFSMFSNAGMYATTFTISGLEKWNTSSVTNMSYMFYYAGYSASNFTTLDLSGWSTPKLLETKTMFASCENLKTIYVGDGWNTSNVTSSRYMFNECTSLVGQSGTKYDSSKTDKRMANWQTGYLTYKPAGTIYFSINGTNYLADEGMTWEQWVNSSYSTPEFMVSGNEILNIYGPKMVCTDAEDLNSAVTKNEIIIPNSSYFLKDNSHSGGGSGN